LGRQERVLHRVVDDFEYTSSGYKIGESVNFDAFNPGVIPMSALQSRYRNGVTNIGMICGFATNTEDGGLHLLTNGCIEMGWTLERSEGARAAEYDFEPVVAICRMEPPADEWTQPRFLALHVSRMPHQLLPRCLIWLARDWPYSSEYTPFGGRFYTYGFSSRVLDALADDAGYPAWLNTVLEGDSVIAEEFSRRARKRILPHRWVLTGRVVSGPLTTPVELPPHGKPIPYFPLQLWQPGDSAPIHLHIKTTKQDARGLGRNPLNMPATVLCRGKRLVFEHNGQRILRSQVAFSVDEILVPSEIDCEASP